MSKTPATKASTKKAAAKSAAPAAKGKTAAKPAAPAKKAAAKAPAKAAPVKAAPAKSAPIKAAAPAKAPAVKAAAPKPVAVAAPAPQPTPPSAAPAPVVRSSRSGRNPPPPPVSAPLPPATSRFADRFAPPRPPTRQMNNLGLDSPKPSHKADPKLANAWKSKAGRDLSEAELMAMPDSEYMNDKQLDFFRHKLQTLKDDLLSNAGETTEHLREDTSIVPDPADRATIEEEHALELRTRDRERKLLKKISQSLGRIEAGDYGFCDETGEPIGLGRLIARPTATLSLEAQQRRELKQKMFGD
ncbi:MAG TPA: RNA polymerase-binding protein DksA [Piscinibacter sp.]|nr:RNA polymerase-binding protein DksA [Piscinibacter sp.]MBP6541959.1 RNA polymerase-binding protein DksA [Piscinibacter sp.]HOY36084.1 RNA polymerase-binding protein DksA [Piscinibacter sp.]HPG79346.1 RNA polymerase-binding protein DksA [Piscinibacter sp.]HPM67633.1 RNA polymerase-binding protein DksA [Piscinibacter sp.]